MSQVQLRGSRYTVQLSECEYRLRMYSRKKINSPKHISYMSWFCARGLCKHRLAKLATRNDQYKLIDIECSCRVEILAAPCETSRDPGWNMMSVLTFLLQQQDQLQSQLGEGNFWMQLCCLQLEASCLQWSFFTCSCVWSFSLTIGTF